VRRTVVSLILPLPRASAANDALPTDGGLDDARYATDRASGAAAPPQPAPSDTVAAARLDAGVGTSPLHQQPPAG